MTKEEFNRLKLEDKFTVNGNPYKFIGKYPLQGIIMGEGSATYIPLPFRFENCELVKEVDELVQYLKSSMFTDHTSDEKAQEIRKICSEEFVNDL